MQVAEYGNMFDTVTIIKTIGLLGIFLVIFFESGIFFGFFLPGDSLLITAGIFAKAGYFPITTLILGVAIASMLGNSVGYFTGKMAGKKFFEREAGIFFKKKYVYEAENFYNKHGESTIVLARFIPIIRTFAPIIAGVAKMKYRNFLFYNILSAIIWALTIPLIGYYVGGLIPNVEDYVPIIGLVVIVLSLLPVIFRALRKYYSKK